MELFQDAIVEDCPSQLNPFIIFGLIIGTVFWISRVIRMFAVLHKMRDIKYFFNHVSSYHSQPTPFQWTQLCSPQFNSLLHGRAENREVLPAQVSTSIGLRLFLEAASNSFYIPMTQVLEQGNECWSRKKCMFTKKCITLLIISLGLTQRLWASSVTQVT